eukprot:Nitzschia sp. Nitz4//scaffold13_size275219//186704//188167//NITZ4_000892-RA/size275219-snap-gene-0.57-mRNA-1//-1//CDS//3329536068//6101//frame0
MRVVKLRGEARCHSSYLWGSLLLPRREFSTSDDEHYSRPRLVGSLNLGTLFSIVVQKMPLLAPRPLPGVEHSPKNAQSIPNVPLGKFVAIVSPDQYQRPLVESSTTTCQFPNFSVPTGIPTHPKRRVNDGTSLLSHSSEELKTPSPPPDVQPSQPGPRLNRFVRRLHDMLKAEQDSGIVEWRRGLLVLHSTDKFAAQVLPKYFNTKNFKTFRRQLNYYGFVHVRSFSATGSMTTALWVNRDLAQTGTDDISSVLQLKRVELCDDAKTVEGRRHRKEEALTTVEQEVSLRVQGLHCPLPEHSTTPVADDHDSTSSQVISDTSVSSRGGTDNSVADHHLDPRTEFEDSQAAAKVLLMLSKTSC